MKKILFTSLSLIALFALVGCAKTKADVKSESFSAVVIDKDEMGIILEEVENLQSYAIQKEVFDHKNLSTIYDETNIGDTVTIEYDGITTRSIPAQIPGLINFTIEAKAEPIVENEPIEFTGVILSIDESFISINIDENQPIAAQEVLVTLDNISNQGLSVDELSVDMPVSVTFNGVMALSLPAQLGGEVIINSTN